MDSALATRDTGVRKPTTGGDRKMAARRAPWIFVACLWLVGCGGPVTPKEKGYVHVQFGQWQEAIADYDEAIAVDPNDGESLTGRGRAYYSLNELDAAMSDYNEAIRVAPLYSEAYYLRAIVYEVFGETKLAAADRQRARTLDPQVQQARVGAPAPPLYLPTHSAERGSTEPLHSKTDEETSVASFWKPADLSTRYVVAGRYFDDLDEYEEDIVVLKKSDSNVARLGRTTVVERLEKPVAKLEAYRKQSLDGRSDRLTSDERRFARNEDDKLDEKGKSKSVRTGTDRSLKRPKPIDDRRNRQIHAGRRRGATGPIASPFSTARPVPASKPSVSVVIGRAMPPTTSPFANPALRPTGRPRSIER